MRLIILNEEFEDTRAGDSQSVAAKQLLGSQPDGNGSRIKRIEDIEGDGVAGVNGKGGSGTMKKHPTLSELKRYLAAKYGMGDGYAGHTIYELLGRD